MSKSLGNVVAPWDVIDRYGADALRWYFFTSKYPWDGYRFSLEAIGESVRQFLLPLWNTYAFYVLYANANGVDMRPGGAGSLETSDQEDLDRWVLSRLSATTETVIERMENFDATLAGRAIGEFLEELSNWYVRRSRRRFWDGDPAALATLRACLVTVAKLLAPFCPFLADEIYDNLDGTEPSVHLCDFPDAGRARPRRSRSAWPWRGRPSGSAWRPVARRSSRYASRCARRWSWPPAQSARQFVPCPRSCVKNSTFTSCASSRKPTSSGRSR